MPCEQILVAEIGSTTTVMNAFELCEDGKHCFLGQGQSPTSVDEGDVTLGLSRARQELEKKLGYNLSPSSMFATSSAAGGLKMTVHGLVYDMTVKASREAALGAGAVVRMVTAGRLKERQLKEIEEIEPNIILLAGGVDHGEEEIILGNARALAGLAMNIPLIYAGNKAIQEEVKEILEPAGFEVLLTENVYPEVDTFNIEPTRKIIQKSFEKHITRAPGMQKIRQEVQGSIMPTPGAVMEAALLLQEEIGDLMVIDAGGATTDVHSITAGSPEIQDILMAPEPFAKRTVEGDLGVFINAEKVIDDMGGKEKLIQKLGFTPENFVPSPIPQTEAEEKILEILTCYVVKKAVERHAGTLKDFYGPAGKTTLAQGKDLTRVKWIIGTGGPLTRLSQGKDILKGIRQGKGRKLLPQQEAEVLTDSQYIMAALGVLSSIYPTPALTLLQESLGIRGI